MMLPPHPMHRADFETIAQGIRSEAKVLDLGCGDGGLLSYLREARGARGYGVEIADEKIAACVRNGVDVIQSDLESGLSTFASNSFDYVILSQTLQAMRHTEDIVREMLRVGREAIVTFPNFGHWSHRLQVVLGRMPVSRDLPYQWYNTPNIHLCTLKDFESFCAGQRLRILERIVMHRGARVDVLPNLLGSLALYRLEKLD
jgi:methionine biosynthesis protein MetW